MSDITLERVTLENFKRHESLVVEFSDKLNVIKGDNYKGKSTLLYAIWFAWFGATAVPGGKEHLVRRGQKTCSVTLEFYSDLDKGVIRRTPTTATAMVNGAVVATGHTAVNQWVEEVFGLDQKTVMTLSYSRQTQTAALMTLGVPALNRLIEDISQTDYIERLIVAGGKRTAKLEAQLELLGPSVDVSDVTRLLAEENELLAAAEEREKSYQALQKEEQEILDEVFKEITVADAHNKVVAQNREKASKLQSTLLAKSERLVTVEGQMVDFALGDIAELDRLAAEARAAYNEASDKSRLYLETVTKVEKLDAWFTKTGDVWEAQAKNIAIKDSLHTENTEDRNAVTKKQNELDILYHEQKTLKAELSSSFCSSCLRPFEGSHKEVHEKKLLSVELAIASHKDTLATLVAREKGSRQRWADVLLPPSDWEESYNSKVVEHTALVEQLTELGGAYEVDLDLLRQTAQTAEIRAAGERSRHEAYQRLSIERQALQVEINGLRAGISEIPHLEPVDSKGLLERYQSKKEDVDRYRRLGNEVGMKLVAHREAVKQYGLTLVKEAQRESDRSQFEKALAGFTGLVKWLREKKNQFLTEMWDGLMAITSEFVSTATFGNVEQVIRGTDGDFAIIEHGVEGGMIAASGGQQAICGTGLKLALASLLPKGTGFMLLDEPSSELNDEHAGAMAAALRMQDRQIIMVSHRDSEEMSADRTIVID